MKKERNLEDCREILAKTGFYISANFRARNVSFDFIARRDDLLLIVKVLYNVLSFTKENAEEMRIVANMLGGVPLIIGTKSGRQNVIEGIVYVRYNIPIMHPNTLKEYLMEGVPPFIFAARGGFYVHLDGDLLRNLRKKRNISLGKLASDVGVSRKSIQMYEENKMNPMVEVAIRIEEYFRHPIIKPLDPLKRVEEDEFDEETLKIEHDESHKIEGAVYERLRQLGYYVVSMRKAPFDALTKEKDISSSAHHHVIILGVDRTLREAAAKGYILGNIASVAEKDSVVIIAEKKLHKENIRGTPVVLKKELEKIEGADEMYDLILERKK